MMACPWDLRGQLLLSLPLLRFLVRILSAEVKRPSQHSHGSVSPTQGMHAGSSHVRSFSFLTVLWKAFDVGSPSFE